METPKKYLLSVGAMFRNESHCIREWIEHYLNQGVEHFYLVNDNSTDNTVDILKPYIDENKVTLYHSNVEHFLGHQRGTYNRFFIPHLERKDTKWLLICDLDEFVYSTVYSTLPQFLESEYIRVLAQVQVTPTIFGSNNLETQPKSLVQGFTKRSETSPTDCGTYKYFVNSDFEWASLNVHHATSKNEEYLTDKYFRRFDPPYLKLNHYICQSREFWINVKCTRGDADGYLTRNLELFDSYCLQGNKVDDFELAKINEKLLV